MFTGRNLPWAFRNADPAVNLWQNDSGLVLTMELAGVDPDALDLTITRNAVTVRGERPVEKLDEKTSWIRRERPETPFHRTIELPVEVDPQSAEAACEKGVLTIRLHRPVEQRPAKVAVRRGT
jgi:HSP20 family protein